MKISWYGQSLFQIITKPHKNSEIKIVIDPFDESLGLRVPRLEADILLITHHHHNHSKVKSVGGDPFLIEGAGEYEIKDIFIRGISSPQDESKEKKGGENTIYTIESEGIKICHLGAFNQKGLSEEQLDKIGEVDILMIPVGGDYIISAKEVPKIMSQLEPHVTIPMNYALPRLKIKLDSLDKFLKAFSIKSLESLPKLLIKKRDISSEEAKRIVLKP